VLAASIIKAMTTRLISLMMEAANISEMSVSFSQTPRRNPEDSLQSLSYSQESAESNQRPHTLLINTPFNIIPPLTLSSPLGFRDRFSTNFSSPSCVLPVPAIFSIIKILQMWKYYIPLFIHTTEVPGSRPVPPVFLSLISYYLRIDHICHIRHFNHGHSHILFFTAWHLKFVQRRTMMMEAASTSETSVNFYHTTWHNNQEDSHLLTFQKFLYGPKPL
jgi:hypothetical protein